MRKTKKDFFSRLKKSGPKRTFKIAALDCETIGLTATEVVLVTYAHEDWGEALVCNNMGEFLDDILLRDRKFLKNTIWFSHNAEFDWRYMIRYFADYDDLYYLELCERMAGQFYQINVMERRTDDKRVIITSFRDSMALYNKSLKDFSKDFSPDLMKTDIGLGNGIEFNKNNPEHVEYAKNDCLCLIQSLKTFDELLYRVFGVHFRGTAASTAYQALLRQIPEGYVHRRLNKSTEDFMRQCYYGGRVQLNCVPYRSYENITVFDINSSYPANMRLGVPKGKPLEVNRFFPEYPGFYYAEVNMPEKVLFPMCPHKNEKGQLSFPVGKFETHLTSIEITQAIELGATINVKRGFIFEDGLNYCFNDFVDMCEKLRSEFKGQPSEQVVKLMQNSVYGKFGTKTEGREVRVDFDGCPPGFSNVVEFDTGKLVEYVYFQEIERDAEYMLPHYAAWITANARLLLDAGIRAANPENMLYCDTDSLHLNEAGTAAIIKCETLIGKRYGQYKLEKTFSVVSYGGPKVYTYKTKGKEEDGYSGTCKGIPQKDLNMPNRSDPKFDEKFAKQQNILERIFNGEVVESNYESVTSLSTNIKTGKFSISRTRKTTNIDNIYSHRIRNGKFFPIKIERSNVE